MTEARILREGARLTVEINDERGAMSFLRDWHIDDVVTGELTITDLMRAKHFNTAHKLRQILDRAADARRFCMALMGSSQPR